MLLRNKFDMCIASVIFVMCLCVTTLADATEFSGDWQGTWTSVYSVSGNLSASIIQSGTNLTGTIDITNTYCGDFSNLPLIATVSGNAASFQTYAYCHLYGSSIDLRYTNGVLSGNTITGDYNVYSDGYLYDWGTFTVTTPAAVANFTANPTNDTAPLTVYFTNLSSGNITGWSWNFGDGSKSTDKNPTHLYNTPGTYTISLTVTGPGGTDTKTRINYITVNHPTPVADFNADPVSGKSPIAVSFTDQSTGTITSRSWNFGDGSTSISQNPSHQYETHGTYTVSLTITGPGGTDTKTRTNYITVSYAAPVANFSANPITGVSPLSVDFSDNSTGDVTSWRWNFGDGSTSTLLNPRHTYNTPCNYTVALTVTGPGGSDTESKTGHIRVANINADINKDNKVDLKDAILVIQVLLMTDPLPNIRQDIVPDISGDGKVGLEEAIYVLQVLSIANVCEVP